MNNLIGKGAISDSYFLLTNTPRPGETEEQSAARTAPRGTDAVNHPPHYNAHSSGVECITVTEHMTFNLGNAVKYIWRAGLKSDDPVTDLEKARWYVEREISRLKNTADALPRPPRPACPPELGEHRREPAPHTPPASPQGGAGSSVSREASS